MRSSQQVSRSLMQRFHTLLRRVTLSRRARKMNLRKRWKMSQEQVQPESLMSKKANLLKMMTMALSMTIIRVMLKALKRSWKLAKLWNSVPAVSDLKPLSNRTESMKSRIEKAIRCVFTSSSKETESSDLTEVRSRAPKPRRKSRKWTLFSLIAHRRITPRISSQARSMLIRSATPFWFPIRQPPGSLSTSTPSRVFLTLCKASGLSLESTSTLLEATLWNFHQWKSQTTSGWRQWPWKPRRLARTIV